MKKIYIKPETLEVKFSTEGMIAASVGVVGGYSERVNAGDDALTNKKSLWDTEDVEEETSGIW
jgi:hypothetical protein